MAIYKIYLRSFAPWRQFGAVTKERSVSVPTVNLKPPTPYAPNFPIVSTEVPYGGAFHGDGRGFSLDTSPAVTARVNALIEVNLDSATTGTKKAWCDESRGPWMGVGFENRATGTPTADFSVSKTGKLVNVVIDYGAANPLVKGAPDIDAKGEYSLLPDAGNLTIDATITGDQFPACESFIEDPCGNKVFLGGFAPDNKEQIMRLYGSMNKPKKVWFESHIVITVDSRGCFQELKGGGSGSNVTGPACEEFTLNVTKWNAYIMTSIPMPGDAS